MSLAYRRNALDVEAFQMTRERRLDNRDWPQWMHEAWNRSPSAVGALYPRPEPKADGTDLLRLTTAEGVRLVGLGNWLVRNPDGEILIVPAASFEKDYEAVPP